MKLIELIETKSKKKRTKSKKKRTKSENEEITAVAGGPPLLPSGSYMGGSTGLAGKSTDPTVGGDSPMGRSTGQFFDSTGTL